MMLVRTAVIRLVSSYSLSLHPDMGPPEDLHLIMRTAFTSKLTKIKLNVTPVRDGPPACWPRQQTAAPTPGQYALGKTPPVLVHERRDRNLFRLCASRQLR